MNNKDNLEEIKMSSGRNRDFPPASIGIGEEVLRAVQMAGGKINTQALESALNTKGGALARKISSARRWNLVHGSGIISITELGQKILHPLSEEEAKISRKKAFLKVQLFSQLYERFKSKIPDNKTFAAILIREYGLKEKDAKIVIGIYKDSLKNFLDAKTEESVSEEDKKTLKENERFDEKRLDRVKLIIESPIGKNIFYASNENEFEKLKMKIENIGNLIDWPEELKEGDENES